MPAPAPSLWTPVSVHAKAKTLIGSGDGQQIRDGIEMLLKNDLEKIGDNGQKKVDSGQLLKRGLDALSSGPHTALGLDIGAKTIDIKKNFRKLALKYHPDKNPMTTPLFQAIQSAKERLSSPTKRKEEEDKARRKARGSSKTEGKPAAHAGGGYGGYGQKAHAARQAPKPAPTGPSQPAPNRYPGSQQSDSYYTQHQRAEGVDGAQRAYQRHQQHQQQYSSANNQQRHNYNYYQQQQQQQQQGPGYNAYARSNFDDEWDRRRRENMRRQADQRKAADAAKLAAELERKRREEHKAREDAYYRQREGAKADAKRTRDAYFAEQERLRKAREAHQRDAQSHAAQGANKEAQRAAAAAAARRYGAAQAARGRAEQAAQEAEMRSAQARAYAEPTPTPDDYGAYARRRGGKDNQQERVSPRGNPTQKHQAQEQPQPHVKPRANPADGERPLYPATGAAHYGRGKQPMQTARSDLPPPKPLGLRCTAVVPMDAPTKPGSGTGAVGETFSEVGLQWVVPPNTSVELSWRRTPMGSETGANKKITSSWETAKTLVKGSCIWHCHRFDPFCFLAWYSLRSSL